MFGRTALRICLLAAFAASPAFAQNDTPQLPASGDIMKMPMAPASPANQPILGQIGVDQKLGNSIPLDLTLTGDDGQPVQLKHLLSGRPIILAPVYFQCPMLCSLTLNQLERSMNVLTESVGQQYDVWTVSFDPKEDSAADIASGKINPLDAMAAKKKRNYLKAYRRTGADAGWHFLTGQDAQLKPLMDSIGFKYKWDEKNQVFAHVATIVVLTPDGKISRYFLGIDYPPVPLRVALQQAQIGTIGEPAEKIFLYCFHYDPSTGKYGLIISRALQVLGVLTILGMLGLVGGLQVYRSKHVDHALDASADVKE